MRERLTVQEAASSDEHAWVADGDFAGDRLVFSDVEEGGASGQMWRWVFHGIEKGAYSWCGANRTDRGRTWMKTWVIEVERKSEEAGGDG